MLGTSPSPPEAARSGSSSSLNSNGSNLAGLKSQVYRAGQASADIGLCNTTLNDVSAPVGRNDANGETESAGQENSTGGLSRDSVKHQSSAFSGQDAETKNARLRNRGQRIEDDLLFFQRSSR
uniref:Uncharacterized protein n=1 Tax=Mycena chlorophos TaxID=658473 RepID=A0ABQ0LFJ4_MYCCL|nr:predicted protein [Mycena chlorophos]